MQVGLGLWLALAVLNAPGARAFEGKSVAFADLPERWASAPAPRSDVRGDLALYLAEGNSAVGDLLLPDETGSIPLFIPRSRTGSFVCVYAGPGPSDPNALATGWIGAFLDKAKPERFSTLPLPPSLRPLSALGLSAAAFGWHGDGVEGMDSSCSAVAFSVYDPGRSVLISVLLVRRGEFSGSPTGRLDVAADEMGYQLLPVAPSREGPWRDSGTLEDEFRELVVSIRVRAPAPILVEKPTAGPAFFAERGLFEVRLPAHARVSRARKHGMDAVRADGADGVRLVAVRMAVSDGSDATNAAARYLRRASFSYGSIQSSSSAGSSEDGGTVYETRGNRGAETWISRTVFRENGNDLFASTISARSDLWREGGNELSSLAGSLRAGVQPTGPETFNRRMAAVCASVAAGLVESAAEADGKLYLSLVPAFDSAPVERTEGALSALLDEWNRIRASRGSPPSDSAVLVQPDGNTRTWRRSR